MQKNQFQLEFDIVYDNKVFNNMKAKLKSNINEITIIHKQLEEVQYKDELLLRVNYSIINSKAKRTVIRIYGTNSTLNHFSEPLIKQFFMMELINVFHNVILPVLILILCHNPKYATFDICAIITMPNELTETYETLYRLLKENYKFSPCLFTLDFQRSNINAITNVFCSNDDDKCVIVTCFFHLVQCWWRKASALGLRKKKYVETTRVLVCNLEILPKEEDDAKKFV